MARNYWHIQKYEEEMLEIKAKGMTARGIKERCQFVARISNIVS